MSGVMIVEEKYLVVTHNKADNDITRKMRGKMCRIMREKV